jgi:transcriptional regulator with XRE-family HTH domain
MSTSAHDVREFLVSRRARLSPDRAGLPAYGGNRRVPGLRREEVALLAGVSVDYYNRLERGNLHGVSEGVLEAVAGALQLDDAERAHLRDLARIANASPAGRSGAPRADVIRPSIQRLLDAITEAPVIVRNHRFDYLGANRLGRALYAPLFAGAANSARFTFLDPAARDFHVQWEATAAELVAAMRGEAGRHPHDRRFSELVGELTANSEEFRVLWDAHDVRAHVTGVKRMRHPEVGELELAYEALELPADPGLTMATFTAEPGTASADKVQLLASWAATQETPA